MLMHFSMIVLSSQLVVAVADHPPAFDIARGCKVDSASAFDPNAGMNATIKRCMDDEQQAKKLPGELYKSLTWDRGKELTDHRRFTLTTNIDVYFCDPQRPWQRGSNENTNGLGHRLVGALASPSEQSGSSAK